MTAKHAIRPPLASISNRTRVRKLSTNLAALRSLMRAIEANVSVRRAVEDEHLTALSHAIYSTSNHLRLENSERRFWAMRGF